MLICIIVGISMGVMAVMKMLFEYDGLVLPFGSIFILFQRFFEQNVLVMLHYGFKHNTNIVKCCWFWTIWMKEIGTSMNFFDCMRLYKVY